MRRDAPPNPRRTGGALEQEGDALAREPAASLVQEQRGPRRPRRQLRPRSHEVILKRPHRIRADRNVPLAPPLAEHADARQLEIDVVDVQRDELGDAQPRAVQQLEKRSIARSRRRLAPGRIEEPAHLLHGQGAREPPRQLGTDDARGRIALDVALGETETMKGADRGQGPRDRGRSVGHAVVVGRRRAGREIRRNGIVVHIPGGASPSRRAELDVPSEVTPVGVHGVPRQPAFHGQVVEIALHLLAHFGDRSNVTHRVAPPASRHVGDGVQGAQREAVGLGDPGVRDPASKDVDAERERRIPPDRLVETQGRDRRGVREGDVRQRVG